MLFNQLLFLFHSFTFLLPQEMKFFKKKSNKQPVDVKQNSSTTQNHEKKSMTETRKTSSDSLLQLSLLDDFSSTINIPQLLHKQDVETKHDNNNIRGDEKIALPAQQKLSVSSAKIDEDIVPQQSTNYNIADGGHEENFSQEVHCVLEKKDILTSGIITSDGWYSSNDLLHSIRL